VSSKKADLIQAVLAAARELSTETVMFHTAIAEQSGLSVTESKALDYLDREGPLTPKELARHSGLAPASVTALVDRLERKGVVRRKSHPDDRRKVLVELNQSHVSAALPLWDYLVSSSVEFCEKYSEEQLETILDFVAEAAAISHRAAERITQSPSG
jgi:DNA-binding MarR family transcriptional regulator